MPIDESVKHYFNERYRFHEHIAGNHHQAIIGLFCQWWLDEGPKVGYDNPILLTGVHAGKEKGKKEGGNVADNLYAYMKDDKPIVVGLLEVEVGAQASATGMKARLEKCLRSVVKHKKEYPELQWAILFSPTWQETYVRPERRRLENVRQEEFKVLLDKKSEELKIKIFNCFAQQQNGSGFLRQVKWWPIETSVHPR
jgi:hypothetical protein